MVLYRKYRPQNLDEVIGQEHVVTTLKNALTSKKVAHAYLFAGPRGTGKTSVARILAKELEVSDLDLIEIDAASNRGIDDVRSLREAINFLPAQSPKKVYILDEAHMLTREAFNALLKTLEEPPEHAHFVLCTTEPHKLPITIISRCLRFDFNLADEEILQNQYIEPIAKKEKIKLEKQVSKLIAQLAQGSFRDALGFLETLSHHIKKGKGILKLEEVQKILGLINEKEAQELNSLILQKDTQTALTKIQQLNQRGINFHHLIQTMIEDLREKLNENLLQEDEATATKNIEKLVALMRSLHQAEQEIKTSVLPQLPLEMVVVEWSLKREDRGWRVEDGEEVGGLRLERNGKITQSSNLNPQISNLQSLWSQILAAIKPHNHSVEALLKGCEPVSFSDNILTLKFFYRFHKERIEEAHNKKLVEKVAGETMRTTVKILCVLGEKQAEQEEEINPVGQSARVDSTDLLKAAQEVFGGQIIE